MLGNIKLGFILLISNYLSPIIIGILTLKKASTYCNEKPLISDNKTANFGIALKNALEKGINTTLQIGAFVVIFSIIISIIKNNAYISIIFNNIETFFNIPKYSLYGLFVGSVEFTNGCKLITTLPLSLPFKLGIISFICSFSGLSVIAQISSFISEYNVSIAKYTFWKFIQGIISFIITFIISNILSITSPVSTLPNNNTFSFSIYLAIYLILLIPILFPLIISCIKKLHSF